MKKIFFFLLFGLSAGIAHSQYSWNIVLHKKILFKGTEVNEEKNMIPVKRSDWIKKGYMEVFFGSEPSSVLTHSFQFDDEDGITRFQKDSTLTVKISATTLRKLYAGKKQLKIFMIIAPADPMMMIPSRRLHLATLILP